MPLRLWRRFKIAPGITVNLSKSGLSTSLGPRGAKVTLGHGRIRRTVGLPGTGLFYTTASNLAQTRDPAASGPVVPPDAPEASGAPPSGQRRSRAGCLAWGVGGVIVLAIIGTLTGNPTASPSAATSTPGARGFVGTTSPSRVAAGQTTRPTATPNATAAPRPTATPEPTATPKPTPKPIVLTVKVTKAPGGVYRNSYASITVKTRAAARCSIDVEYASGPSTASGLGDKTANSSGYVSWTWKIGGSTTKGTWPIYISCTWNGQDAEADSQVTVR